MLLLLHLLPAMLPTAALAGCTGAGADRQLILAKVRARVLEHLSPPLLQEELQKEMRRVHRRDVLENTEVEPEEMEDTSQVILFPSTGENILVGWKRQSGEVGGGSGQHGCSRTEGLLWWSAREEKEGTPGWGMGMGMMESQETERYGRQGPAKQRGTRAAQEGAESLENGWARQDAERWGGLRSRQGGIGWDATEWGRCWKIGWDTKGQGRMLWDGAGRPAMGQDTER